MVSLGKWSTSWVDFHGWIPILLLTYFRCPFPYGHPKPLLFWAWAASPRALSGFATASPRNATRPKDKIQSRYYVFIYIYDVILCMYVWMSVCLYVCMSVCLYVCMCVCVHACMDNCIDAMMYGCMDVCMCVCMSVCRVKDQKKIIIGIKKIII